jgi:AcrR family transcriptional regulator
MAPVKFGDRLPSDFITCQRQQRITKAVAELVTENGYHGTKIADIVRRAGVARKTFYDAFAGKEDAARALIAEAWPSPPASCPTPLDRTGLTLLALEAAARWKVEGPEVAAGNLVAGLDVLRSLPTWPVQDGGEEELRCSLPPGRHGLPHEFVLRNQRHRLLTALARVIREKGWCAITIGDITAAACVSRRTFYEHFEGKDAAGIALGSLVSENVGLELKELGLGSGLGVLMVEVLAGGVSAASAGDSLRLLHAQFDPSVLEEAA